MKKILGIISAAIIFSTIPAYVSAMSTTSSSASYSNYSEEELVSLIAKLQKQLEEVRKNKVACVLPSVDLSIGDGDGDNLRDHVKALQNFLKEKGYLGTEATGYFGKATRAAVIAYQKASGLDQTGELNGTLREAAKMLKCKRDYTIRSSEPKKEYKEFSESKSPVSSISLAVSGSTVKWATNGYSKNGFKVVWSKNPGPTYPTRDGDKYNYLSEPGSSMANLDAFAGSGTYYVRVCEYLGGACGVYSNEVSTTLQ